MVIRFREDGVPITCGLGPSRKTAINIEVEN